MQHCRDIVAGGRRGRLLALSLAASLAALPALPQTASELVAPTFAPELRPLDGALVFTGEPGLGAPPGAEALSIRIGAVDIEGGFPEMAAAEQATIARLTEDRIPASEIFEAAQALEAEYARAGFVLARVVLPAQELRDGGRLRLTVVDGFVERIDTDAVPAPVRARIEEVVQPVAGRPGLRLEEIERALLLAGDTFGVALDSALARGDAPGATQLVLDAQFRPVTGFVGFDRGLSDQLGNWTLEAGIEANALLGRGETLYFRFAGAPGGGLLGSTPRLRTLAAGAVLPIGTDGLTINLEGVQSRTTPRPDPDTDATTSRFERLSLRLAYPWVRTRERTVAMRLVFDALSDGQDSLGADGTVPRYRDRLRVVRLGGNVVQRTGAGAGGVLELDALASVGIDALGARSAADATPEVPLSRDGAEPRFAKLALSAELSQPLGERFVGVLSARGQSAFGRPLPKSEQIGLSGAGLLSGVEPGALLGDSGWLLRGELRLPQEVSLGDVPLRVTPYVFAATGTAYLHRASEFERSRVRGNAAGLGLEMLSSRGATFSSATVRVEIARGSWDDALLTEDRRSDTRFSIGGALRF